MRAAGKQRGGCWAGKGWRNLRLEWTPGEKLRAAVATVFMMAYPVLELAGPSLFDPPVWLLVVLVAGCLAGLGWIVWAAQHFLHPPILVALDRPIAVGEPFNVAWKVPRGADRLSNLAFSMHAARVKLEIDDRGNRKWDRLDDKYGTELHHAYLPEEIPEGTFEGLVPSDAPPTRRRNRRGIQWILRVTGEIENGRDFVREFRVRVSSKKI